MPRGVTEPTSPLQIADYRSFWLARFLAVFSTLSMVVLIGYQTYDVARSAYAMDRSHAAFMLGLLGAAQFVPLMLLTPVAGVAADRFDRRIVVLCANGIDAFIAGHERAALRRKHGLDPDAVIIANIGSTCERKGQHIYIRAIDLLGKELAAHFLGKKNPVDHGRSPRRPLLGNPARGPSTHGIAGNHRL